MTPSTPTIEKHELDRAAFDRDCRNYAGMKTAEQILKSKADVLKARIMATIEQHGFVPTNAEKSRRIEGSHFVATVTTGTGIEIDDSKVFDLELLLSRARCGKAFKFLFERRVEYSLARTAKETIETTPWPKKYRDQITALYSSCFTPKTRTPSLDVESRASVAEREAKAAQKKAKAGKKVA